MTFINPQLLLSGQIAFLVLLASVLAASIIWLWYRQRLSAAMEQAHAFVSRQEGAGTEASAALELARSLSEELRRNLAATESQCVEALEQRDEADRQAVLRAVELRRINEELTQLKLAAPVPPQPEESGATISAELDRLQQELQALREQAALAEALATQRHEQLEKFAKDSATAEAALKAQIEQLTKDSGEAEALLRVQIDQLAKDKAQAEAALQAQLHQPVEAPAASSQPRAIQLPRPPLPPIEVLNAPVDDTLDHFPPAPPAHLRKLLGDEAAHLASGPELPSQDEAHETLKRLTLQLEEREQLVTQFGHEQDRRNLELDAARLAGPEAGVRLHAAEKSEHSGATRLAEAREERDRSRRQVRALTRALAAADAQPLQADDLTLIKGIKGGINHQLHAFGIQSYFQIVQWDEEDVQAFSELLAFKNRIRRDKWQDQARALMLAKYGEDSRLADTRHKT